MTGRGRNPKLTTALLARAAKAAARHAELSDMISDAMVARYSATHSDVDCDIPIDALDYGRIKAPTLNESDAAMTACGRPPVEELETGA